MITDHRLDYHPCVYAGIDLRMSYWATAIVDIKQTTQFKRMGISEANPLADTFLQRGNLTFTIAAVGSVFLIDDFIRKQDSSSRQMLYGVALGIECAAVWNNHKLGLKGIPILLPAVHW